MVNRLEMATVLVDFTLKDMELFYSQQGSTLRGFHENEEATSLWIEKLRSASGPRGLGPLSWIPNMLQATPKMRPTISQVIAQIADAQCDHNYFCFRCIEAEQEGGTQEFQKYRSPAADMVTGSMLQDYMNQDHRVGQATSEDDDTVTAQFLEDVGAVTIASNQDPDTIDATVEHTDDEYEELDELELDTAGSKQPKHGSACTSNDPAQAQLTDQKQEKSPAVVGFPADAIAQHEPTIEEASMKPTPPRSALKVTALGGSKDVKENTRAGKQVTFGSTIELEHKGDRASKERNSSRFSGLGEDRRPLPSVSDPEPIAIDDQPVIAPEPLCPPPLKLKDCYPLPKASLVPSYILAGSNRFSKQEIVGARSTTFGTSNLFVYGRLMFPSALRGFAAQSIAGVYSPMHQRRLVTASQDWARADHSIQRAAEVMTPACLKNFDVWRPSGYELAAIQDSPHTETILTNRRARNLGSLREKPGGEVVGFLIRGVTEEALRYCDLIFCSNEKNLRRARAQAASGENKDSSSELQSNFKPDAPFERRVVSVDIQLSTDETRTVSAYTFVWKKGVEKLWHPWRSEDFVRGPDLHTMSTVESRDWRQEETSLAKTMKMSYALVGDELCAAILSEDAMKLQELLDQSDNVDAQCRKYGTPLQAAVVKGYEDMARLLLNYGANPSKGGGRYATPLIAAAVGSRKSITRLLIKKRADVFATDKQNVNALYQAVGRSDWAITEMLLEAGAWLIQDYGEVKDLALEKGDTEIQSLLQEYDIRDAKLARLEADKSRDWITDGKMGNNIARLQLSSQVAKMVLKKFLVLSSEPGSWRGRKGVAVTRAALAAGASSMILDHIRSAIDPVSKLIDLLKESDKRHEEAMERDTRESGRVEELTSDGEEEIEQEKRKATSNRPEITFTYSSKDNRPSRSRKVGSPVSSRASSTSTDSLHSEESYNRSRRLSQASETRSPTLSRRPSVSSNHTPSPSGSPRSFQYGKWPTNSTTNQSVPKHSRSDSAQSPTMPFRQPSPRAHFDPPPPYTAAPTPTPQFLVRLSQSQSLLPRSY